MTLQRSTIESIIGKKIVSMTPLSGGMIAEVYQINFADGETVVAKAAHKGNATLDTEGKMLDYLKQHSNLPVPSVLHSEKTLLIMSYIENQGGISNSVQEDAAHHLAALHRVTADQFGLAFDTLIGSLQQPNPLYENWIDFFREQRLIYMAEVAQNAGQLLPKLRKRIERFATRLEDYLYEPDMPSLIHGDMWGGNILALNSKIAGFVDPAIYYAHPEIELAFSTLFGTFGQTFFDVYNNLRPIEPDFFEERRHIYNLYPLLVHVHLFGSGYVAQVDSILDQFGY